MCLCPMISLFLSTLVFMFAIKYPSLQIEILWVLLLLMCYLLSRNYSGSSALETTPSLEYTICHQKVF